MGISIDINKDVAVYLASVDIKKHSIEETVDDSAPTCRNINQLVVDDDDALIIEQSFSLEKFNGNTGLIIEISYTALIRKDDKVFNMEEINEINRQVIERITWSLFRSMSNVTNFQTLFSFPFLPLTPINIKDVTIASADE